MNRTSDPALQRFRGDARAPLPLHPLERVLVAVAGVQAGFLPWAMGGMRLWAQGIALALALVALVLALWPRRYAGELTREGPYQLRTYPKLLRFPPFWLGLALLAYGVVQGLNPAWERVLVNEGRAWTMRPLAHLEGLPAGMRTPLEIMNPWRQLMIWAGGWLLACALWTGLTRRVAILRLLLVIVINAAVLGLVGIAQWATADGKILWAFRSSTPYHFATILYKNHAGAFFSLATVAALALAMYHHVRAERRLARSNPSGIFLLLAILGTACVLLTLSRAATLLLLAFLVVGACVMIVRLLFFRRGDRSPLVLGILGALFVVCGALAFQALNLGRSIDKFEALFGRDRFHSVTQRQLAVKAGWDMAQEHLVTGWGAGGFRFMFPSYQRHYPEIAQSKRGTQVHTLFWEHAHNDYLQLLIEVGLIGVGLVGAGLVSALVLFTRDGGWRRLPQLVLFSGAALTLGHAWVDFPFQNPAVLTTWCALAALALRWTQLERA